VNPERKTMNANPVKIRRQFDETQARAAKGVSQ
jgi:hypothetical protein